MSISLSRPLTLPCGAVLRNRIAKAATSEGLASDHMLPTPRHAALYRRWAEGGAGLLLTGNVMIDERSRVAAGDVGVGNSRGVGAFVTWARSVTDAGAHFWMQLNHPGRQTPRKLESKPVAPSAIRLKRGGFAFAEPRELAESEILSLIDRFGQGAAFAREAGFTGVQLHGAHGYLISQFLSPRTNIRSDAWGGSPERRCRFLVEVLRSVRARVGRDFPVGLKLNSRDFARGGLSEDDSIDVALTAQREGIDLLEISGGTYENDIVLARRQGVPAGEAYFGGFADKLRPRCSVPLMLTGGFRSGQAMEGAVDSNRADVVGLARAIILVPDLPARLFGGQSIPPFRGPARFGIGLTDSAMELSWYEEQIHRMASGHAPDPALGRASAFLRALRRYA